MGATDERFVALYQRHYRAVYSYCRRRTTADRAEDAVAETFLVAWRRIAEMPDDERTLAWLYGVAYRVLGQQWRTGSRQRRLIRKLDGLGEGVVSTPDDHVLIREEQSQVREAASVLKATELEILRLALWEELPQADIAVALGLNIDAVRQRLSRAKKRLTSEYNRLEDKYSKPPAARKGGGR